MENKFQKNVFLAPLTSFKIGGPAKFFYQANNYQQIVEAVKWAQDNKESFFILGSGTNILVSDQGFNGLVIKNEAKSFKFQKNILWAESGAILLNLIMAGQKRGLGGWEKLVGIPGTLGGAIYGNAGAYGSEIKDFIKKVGILRNNQYQEIKKAKFYYRNSEFKINKDIILWAEINLKKINPKNSLKQIKEYLLKRKNYPSYPSAGSIFKNIKDQVLAKKIIQKLPQAKKFWQKYKAIPVGFLVEEAGLKGKKIGEAQISEKHGNCIVNLGKAEAEDVIILIAMIKSRIRNLYGIQLEEEIEYLGFE